MEVIKERVKVVLSKNWLGAFKGTMLELTETRANKLVADGFAKMVKRPVPSSEGLPEMGKEGNESALTAEQAYTRKTKDSDR